MLFSQKKIKKHWGYIEELASGPNWRVDRLVIKPGKVDSLHAQPSCKHTCFVAEGIGRVTVGVNETLLHTANVKKGDEFIVNADWLHCYENIGKKDLVIIQSSFGDWDLKEMVNSL